MLCIQAGLDVALDLLLSIAEEVSALDSRKQSSFVQKAMQPQAEQMFGLLGRVLHGCSTTTGEYPDSQCTWPALS